MQTTPSETPRSKFKLGFRALSGALRTVWHRSVITASVCAGLGMIAPAMAQAQAQEQLLIGSVIQTAASFCPDGSLEADGRVLPIAGHTGLHALLEAHFGGNGRSDFALPDLTGSADVKGMRWCIQASGQFPVRDFNNTANNGFQQAAPSGLVIRTPASFCPASWRLAPSDLRPTNGTIQDCDAGTTSKTDFAWYYGQIVTVRSTTCPAGTLPANGQSLSIAENTPLFAYLSSDYGGDDRTTFNLPNIPTTSAGILSCIVQDGEYPQRPR